MGIREGQETAVAEKPPIVVRARKVDAAAEQETRVRYQLKFAGTDACKKTPSAGCYNKCSDGQGHRVHVQDEKLRMCS
ncbi:hypothetical protein Pcinc_036215 [Petrolisthes cinctipes]|uniref:Uncharacterized protein n=1 Tax=Petrolisthes cinctipes TaxID=88211 RepID=A0AAE1BY91_PETCI|nr:hypothetical protein Pcinc_036215 [Petrolisthes cinctipes]